MRVGRLAGGVLGALGLAASAMAASSATDPKGDVRPGCYGECSKYSVDLKSIALSRSGGDLRIKVSQYGAFKPAQPLYWPQLELYTKSPLPSRPPEAPFDSNPADYSVFVNGGSGGSCPRPAGSPVIYEMDLWKGNKALHAIGCSWPSQSTIIYYVPLKALGNPAHVRVRAWQGGVNAHDQRFPLDVAPDHGTVSG